jgi:hypothetical protein
MSTVKLGPGEPLGMPWWRHVVDLLVDKARWLLGAPLLVIACGFLLLWWMFLQQHLLLKSMLEKATSRADARLVERYFLVEPRDPATLDHPYAPCESLWCAVDYSSVAVFEFATAKGPIRVEARDFRVHDWQHPTPYELGIPLLGAEFRFAPDLAEGKGPEWVAQVWQQVDQPVAWLPRLRPQPLSWTMPVRFDPANPQAAVLEGPEFRRWASELGKYLSGQAYGLIFFAAFFIYLLMMPAIGLLMPNAKRWQRFATIGAICVTLPLWAPYAGRIAPHLSETSGAVAEFLRTEFGHIPDLSFVTGPVQETGAYERRVWTLEASEAAPFFAGLQLAPPGVAALDLAAGFDDVQRQIDEQMRAMPPDQEAAVLRQLRHYRAVDLVLELYLPALLRIAARGPQPSDPPLPSETADETAVGPAYVEARQLLAFLVDDWEAPDTSTLLAEHRIANFERLAQLPELREQMQAKVVQARARIAQQKAS